MKKKLNDLIPTIEQGLSLAWYRVSNAIDKVYSKLEERKNEISKSEYEQESLSLDLITGMIKNSCITFDKDILIKQLEDKGYDMDYWK